MWWCMSFMSQCVHDVLWFTIEGQLCFTAAAFSCLFEWSKRCLNAVVHSTALLHILLGCVECLLGIIQKCDDIAEGFFCPVQFPPGTFVCIIHMGNISHSLICSNLQSGCYHWVFDGSSPRALMTLKLENSELCRSSDAPWCEYCLCDALPDSDPLPSSNGKLFRLMPLLRDIGIACCGTSALLGLGSSPLITLVGLWPWGSLSFVDGTRMMGSTTSPSTSSAPSDSTSATLPSEYSQKWSGDRAALVALNIKVALSE